MSNLTKITRSLIFLFLLCGGLYFAKDFLVPVAFGGIFAMLLTPMCSWLENKSIGKALSAILCVFLFLVIVGTVLFLLSWQVTGLADDAVNVVALINKFSVLVQQYIAHTFGLPLEMQQQIIKEQSSILITNSMYRIAIVSGSIASLIGLSVLVLVYIFLFIYYRNHLGNFVLKLVSEENKERTGKIIASSGHLGQQYISGLGIVIVLLWIMYGIGFSIIGVKHALFFAVLCGLLEIVPYLGNIIVSLLTAIVAFSQGGATMALWVLAIYGLIQFVQNYILDPLIVGAKVSINPLCTIVVIVVGEMIWGIPGMILAIPLLGIVKIIFDNTPGLEAFGYLIGEIKTPKLKE